MTKRWKEVSPYTGEPVKEDALVNNAGGGNIHGIGVGPHGEPGFKKKKKKELKDRYDGRTKSYKSHRAKLEANRLARIARAENRRKSGFVENIKNRIKEFAFGGYDKTQPVADMDTNVPKKKKNAKNK